MGKVPIYTQIIASFRAVIRLQYGTLSISPRSTPRLTETEKQYAYLLGRFILLTKPLANPKDARKPRWHPKTIKVDPKSIDIS
jgi:hypothetical protein